MAAGIKGCKVCSNETVRSQVDRMFSEGLSDARVVKALASIGVSITETSVFRHRKRHYKPEQVEPVEYDENMVIERPKTVEPAPAIQGEAAALLDAIKQQVDTGELDVTRDRMIRETLLSKIFEQHLALTSTALDRYINGDGRYPADAVKGLASIHSIFEKTSLHKSASISTAEAVLEKEILRREEIVYQAALALGKEVTLDDIRDDPVDLYDAPEIYLTKSTDYGREGFYFGGQTVRGHVFKNRMDTAWYRGMHEALSTRGLWDAAVQMLESMYAEDEND